MSHSIDIIDNIKYFMHPETERQAALKDRMFKEVLKKFPIDKYDVSRHESLLVGNNSIISDIVIRDKVLNTIKLVINVYSRHDMNSYKNIKPKMYTKCGVEEYWALPYEHDIVNVFKVLEDFPNEGLVRVKTYYNSIDREWCYKHLTPTPSEDAADEFINSHKLNLLRPSFDESVTIDFEKVFEV